MRKVKLNNDDLFQYLNTIESLKQHPTMTEYKAEYRRLRTNGSPLTEAKKFKSAHIELLRLDRKKTSLLNQFLEELNPVSHTSALVSGKLEKLEKSILYRKTLLEKAPDELFALVISQRTNAGIELKHAIEKSIDQLSKIASAFEAQQENTIRRKLKI